MKELRGDVKTLFHRQNMRGVQWDGWLFIAIPSDRIGPREIEWDHRPKDDPETLARGNRIIDCVNVLAGMDPEELTFFP